MRKAEKEIGENRPREMIGLDSEDVREVEPASRGGERQASRRAEENDEG